MQEDDAPEAEQRQARKPARELALSDLKWQMSTKQGRRFVYRLLATAGVNERSFTGNSETFFREGRRSLGLEMQADITTHCFPEFVLMLQEAQAKTQ